MEAPDAKRRVSARGIRAVGYLKRHGSPKRPEDLRSHRCVVFRHPVTGKTVPWTFQRGKKIESIDIKGSLITNDSDTQRQAVLQSVGIGQLASFFVSSHLKDNTLEPLLMNYVAQPFAIYLCRANPARIPKRISILFSFLDERLSNHEDFAPFAVKS
jgi:DNA-binding transcriptional LysR family regulator